MNDAMTIGVSPAVSAALNRMAIPSLNVVAQFRDLVAALRPDSAHRQSVADARFTRLCEAIEDDPVLCALLRARFVALLAGRRQVSFFADSGILPGSGFFSDLWRRLVQRVLPAISDEAYLKDCVNQIFHERDDYVWLAGIPRTLKMRFWKSLGMDSLAGEAAVRELLTQLLDAGDRVAARIAAMGLEPELVRLYPRIEERDSPFLALALEAHQLAAAYRGYLSGGVAAIEDERQLQVLIAQCCAVLGRIRARAASIGTSLSVTYLVERLEQSLHRLDLIVQMLAARHAPVTSAAPGGDAAALTSVWMDFLDEAIKGEARRRGIRTLISRTIGLLALRVTHNAARTGEHYITTERAEYLALWRSAMGAGLIVGVMALVKLALGKTEMSPLLTAMTYSADYALGFMLVHALGFTIATKQPAMTAATIASAISETRGRLRDLERLATLVIDVIRSQIAAIVGNVMIALPVAVALGLVFAAVTGRAFIEPAKADALLHFISPFDSLALLYAAIAGVCLFLTGLISGYYDNLAAYEQIRARILEATWLTRLLGAPAHQRLADYLHEHLGALAGNICFGIMLGSMGVIGLITGLPLEVCHVTFSAAYLGFSAVALDFSIGPWTLLNAVLGVALIGAVNLTVSFALALWVALRARRVPLSEARMLLPLLKARWRRNWRNFFWPS